MPYLDNYWSDSFGPKCDPPVFGALHLPKYFGNLSNFISRAIPKFQKTSVINCGNTSRWIRVRVSGDIWKLGRWLMSAWVLIDEKQGVSVSESSDGESAPVVIYENQVNRGESVPSLYREPVVIYENWVNQEVSAIWESNLPVDPTRRSCWVRVTHESVVIYENWVNREVSAICQSNLPFDPTRTSCWAQVAGWQLVISDIWKMGWSRRVWLASLHK